MIKIKRIAMLLLSVIFLMSAVLLTSNLFAFSVKIRKLADNGELYRTKPLSSVSEIEDSELACLSTLKYNGNDIRGFVESSFIGTHNTDEIGDTAVYKIELASGTTSVPVVEAAASRGGVTEITNATDLSDNTKNFTLVRVTESEVVHYYKLIFTVAVIPNDAVYKRDFNDSSYDVTGWQGFAKGGNLSTTRPLKSVTVTDDGMLAIAPNGDETFAMDMSANINSYEKMVHAKIKFQGAAASYGARFGMTAVSNSNNWFMTMIDGKKILWETNSAWQTSKATEFSFQPNIIYDLAIKTIKVDDSNVKMRFYVDGSSVFEEVVPFAYVNDALHNFGFRIRDNMILYVDDLYVTADMPADPAPPTFSQSKEDIMPMVNSYEEISSADMKVMVGNDFPFIYRYKNADDSFLANGIEPLAAKYNKKLIVNGNLVSCVNTQIEKTNNSITYNLRVNDYDGSMFAEFKVKLTVKSGKRLKLEFIEIKEAADTIVKTFSLPNHSMVSMRGDDVSAAVGQVQGWGPMGDKFVNMTDVSASEDITVNSYTLLNDMNTAVAIENNAIDSKQKFVLSKMADIIANDDNEYVRRLAVRNNTWAWNFYNKTMTKMPKYEVPYSEVIFGGDQNENSDVDWHDAALLYRDIMVKPYKSEDTKDYYTYIAFNMSGMANNPSLRILDRAKALSYITDGFGQKVMNKGYQVGGHDDSHGDYDNVSMQQGGAKDFEYLSKRGADYNIKTGIHFNATEFPLDGFETVLENMALSSGGLNPNWSWMDQAYWVDKNKDLVSGELQRRVKELGVALPNLDFVYVDVWQEGSTYTAKALQNFFEQQGYGMATEAAGDFTGDVLMYHWNNDLYYATGGTQSEVVGFIYNDLADLRAPNRALLGMLMPGVAQWKDSNFNEGYEVFYRNNLATKYMQYFELLDWVKDESATFSDNVKTVVTSDGGNSYYNLYKDEKLLAKIDVSDVYLFDSMTDNNKPAPEKTGDAEVFIPWSPITEEKIYYWNDVNSESTWDVPQSWAGTSVAHLYKMTTSGRTYVGEVAVANGKVTIVADKSTPYVLSKEKTDLSGLAAKRLPRATDNWGEGSAIKNFGFTSGNFESWSVAGDPTVHEQYAYEYPHKLQGNNTFNNKGDALVEFKSARSTLNQTLTVSEDSMYSFSVWAYSENRAVTLRVVAGDKTYNRRVLYTHKLNTMLDPNKYKNTRFQRMEVEVPIPKGITTIQLELIVEEGEGKVLIDDFRAWEWMTPRGDLPDYYLAKEDFENVDEQHGIFVAYRGGEPGYHLAQRDISPNSKQIKDYVIDGEWSLKDPVTSTGLHLRTMPSTLDLQSFMGQYKISFDYMTFNENRKKQPRSTIGYNMPTDATYQVQVNKEDGTAIYTETLKKSTFATTTYTYNSRPSVEHFELYIDGQKINDNGSYISIYKITEDDDSMLVLDNIEVIKMRRDGTSLVKHTMKNEIMLEKGGSLDSTIQVKTDNIGDVTLDVRYEGFNPELTDTSQMVTAVIDTRDFYLGSSFSKTYQMAVFVKSEKPKDIISGYVKPADKTATISGEHGLPRTIAVTLANGQTVYLPVTYNGYNADKAGVQTVTGTIDTAGYDVGASFENKFFVSVQVLSIEKDEPVIKGDDSNKGLTLGLGLGLGIPVLLASGGTLAIAIMMFLKRKNDAK